MDQDKISTRWFEYISELYKDDSRGQLPHIKPGTAGIPITLEEIQHVLTEMLVVAGECGLENNNS